MARPNPVPPYLRRRARVGLLEGLEDQPLLFRRHADAGIFDGEGDHLLGLAQHRVIDAPAAAVAKPTRTATWPCEVNFTALESRFLRICCRRLASLIIARGRSSANSHVERQVLAFGHVPEVAIDVSRRPANEISSASTVTVPDSIFERSRMSLIRFNRSEPEEWTLRAKFDLLGRKVAAGVVGQLLTENQDRIERRAQFVRHVGEELGLVLRGQRQLGGLFFQRATGLLDLGVLAFHFGILLGQQLAPCCANSSFVCWSSLCRD